MGQERACAQRGSAAIYELRCLPHLPHAWLWPLLTHRLPSHATGLDIDALHPLVLGLSASARAPRLSRGLHTHSALAAEAVSSSSGAAASVRRLTNGCQPLRAQVVAASSRPQLACPRVASSMRLARCPPRSRHHWSSAPPPTWVPPFRSCSRRRAPRAAWQSSAA